MNIPYNLLEKSPSFAYQPLDDIDKIDAVYTFVDMEDPAWCAKFKAYTGEEPGPLRYRSYNELEYSVSNPIYTGSLICPNVSCIRTMIVLSELPHKRDVVSG